MNHSEIDLAVARDRVEELEETLRNVIRDVNSVIIDRHNGDHSPLLPKLQSIVTTYRLKV